MTNLEYITSKGIIDEGDELCLVAHVCKYNNICIGKTCEECEFNNNVDLCVKTMLEEHREPIKLTMAEKVILENVDKSFKWIARDNNGYLYAYIKKPCKLTESWNSESCIDLRIFNHLFQFIKWEDEEPYNIQEILDNCEVIDKSSEEE